LFVDGPISDEGRKACQNNTTTSQGPQSVRIPAVTCIEASQSSSLANLVSVANHRVEIPVDSGEVGVSYATLRRVT
jgi:hypothetical protein